MRGVVMHAPGEVRVEDRPEPVVLKPTDAVIRLSATCICGSDLWPYRGADAVDGPTPMGHEYVGVVEEVGAEVTSIEPGQFVVGSFFASDNTCEICRAGYQTSCIHRQPGAPDGAQAQRMRVPLADGTLVATPDSPTTTWCRTSSPPPTSWVPGGSGPWPPRQDPAEPSRSSVTARSVSWPSWRPSSWAPNGSSR